MTNNYNWLYCGLIQVVYDQPGLPVPQSWPHLKFLDVNVFKGTYVHHLFCLNFMALESRPFWLQPIDSKLHSKGKTKYCIL